jgi:hypothetical protein
VVDNSWVGEMEKKQLPGSGSGSTPVKQEGQGRGRSRQQGCGTIASCHGSDVPCSQRKGREGWGESVSWGWGLASADSQATASIPGRAGSMGQSPRTAGPGGLHRSL